MSAICIQNGRIIDPVNLRDQIGDLFIQDGKIVESLSPEALKSAKIIRADGLIVSPGFIDMNVHLRYPGQKQKEDIYSGTRAAAAGGFTSIVCMPNTSPVGDNSGTIQRILNAVERDALVNVFPTGCLTEGMAGKMLASIGSLKSAGVVAITDDNHCVQNNEIMRRVVEYAQMFDLLVIDHCQDAAMTEGAAMHEGPWSLRLGLKGFPSAAEDLIIARNVVLSKHTGGRIHMQHISSAYGVDIIRRAKKRGIAVSCEVTPHHLTFTDADCATYNTNFKVNPPLRSEDDRQALIEGLLDGTIDAIATDHAPHSNDEKDCEFDRAPFGIIGMETALASLLELLVHSCKCDLNFLLSRLTERPAKIIGLDKGSLSVGADADVTLFDLNERWTVDPDDFQSKSSNCPWNGKSLRGRVKKTIIGGKLIWEDGLSDHLSTF